MSEKNININDGAANDEELDFMLGRKRKQAPYSKEEKPTVMPGAALGAAEVGAEKPNKTGGSIRLNSTGSG